MIRINLLPFRAARKKENVRRQISIFLLLLALTLILVFYSNYSLNSEIDDLKKKVAAAKVEKEKYKKITAQIKELEVKLAALKKQKEVIVDLELNRKEPLRLLESMTEEVVEKRMWFKTLSYVNNVVSVTGTAIDEKTVADFMTNLENATRGAAGPKQYKNVTLKSIQKHKQAKGQPGLKQFEIQFTKEKVTTASDDKATKK
jgi:type IV pilus assembly protein PilN